MMRRAVFGVLAFFAAMVFFSCGGEPGPQELRCGYEAQVGERCRHIESLPHSWNSTDGVCVRNPLHTTPGTAGSVCVPECDISNEIGPCWHVTEPDGPNRWWTQRCVYVSVINGKCLCGNTCVWPWFEEA